ncbi:PIPO, partial [Fritillary virus Y]|uniref:PIPO n=1 Tax=Fritillary virus Y TaxID=332471 RepID=UPI00026515C6
KLCGEIKTAVARIKLVCKIFYNMAVEKVYTTYGRYFDQESNRRKKRVFKKICERVFHNNSIIPEERKEYCFAEM